MPTFSRSLEQSLHRALAIANERHHEYATLEHLLLALIDDQDASAVMRACNVDLDKLRRSLTAYLESELENLITDGAEDSKPTAGFQRVIQRAVIHVQSSGREEVTGANVLVAIFAERESHAAYFLQEQDMTRYDAVNYISHGIAKRPGLSESRPISGSILPSFAFLFRLTQYASSASPFFFGSSPLFASASSSTPRTGRDSDKPGRLAMPWLM